MTVLRRDRAFFAVIPAALGLLFGALHVSGQDHVTLRQLNEIDNLRAGVKTPFAEAKKRTDSLLRRYPSSKDQALIYYTLAGVYAQSGFAMQKDVAGLAEKALALGLDPQQAMAAYQHWGNSIQMVNGGVRGTAFAEVRRQAVVPYLSAVRVALVEGVPYDRKVVIPRVVRPQIVHRLGQRTPAEKAEVARYVRDMAQHDRARLHQRMSLYLEAQIAGISYLYSSFPLATSELESLAKEILKDDVAVNYLMDVVNERLRKRIADMAGDARPPPPKDPVQAVEDLLHAVRKGIQECIAEMGGDMPLTLSQELIEESVPAPVQEVVAEELGQKQEADGDAEEGGGEEGQSPARKGAQVERGNSVLFIVLAAVLASVLLAGAIAWRRRRGGGREVVGEGFGDRL